MKIKLVLIILITALIIPVTGHSQAVSDYLILRDIGPYKLDKPEKMFPGEPPSGGPKVGKNAGVVGSSHFADHGDTTYEVMYLGPDDSVSPIVTITQHAGADSDKWLLHEVDSAFRDKYGIPAVSYYPWQIEGQTVFIDAVGGREYRWVNGNIVIAIEYHESLRDLPEPKEIVKAYLAKHPSTLQTITLSQLRSESNKTKWIKDEMERRLWLADKWFAQIQTADPKLRDKLKSMTDSMVVFLNYREKYFTIAAKDEKIEIETALFQNNTNAVQAKLTEYKAWWTAHKGDSITLP